MVSISQLEVLNNKQAASYLQISERQLYSLRTSGEIDFFQIGRGIRYRKPSLDRFTAHLEELQRQNSITQKMGDFKNG